MSIRKRLSALLDRWGGPDEEESVGAALDQRDELETKVRPLRGRRPDFRVNVYWDDETEEFQGEIFVKFMEEPFVFGDLEGTTPGEVFALAGMLLDGFLARRGFRREKKRAENLDRKLAARPKAPT